MRILFFFMWLIPRWLLFIFGSNWIKNVVFDFSIKVESNIFWCPPILYCTWTQTKSKPSQEQNNNLPVSGTKAFGEGHTQYIGDPSGMIDVRSTALAPKQNPRANSKNNRPGWAYTQALNYQQIVLRRPRKNTSPHSRSRTWVRVFVIMSRFWSPSKTCGSLSNGNCRFCDNCVGRSVFFCVCPTGWNAAFSISF